MVENSLEKNGPKILLPQIIDAVTALQTAGNNDDTPTTSSEPTHVDSTATSAPEETAPVEKNTELGPLDVPLPISIPGLNSGGSKKESGGGGSETLGVKSGGSKKEGVAEQTTLKAKPKSKTSSSTSATAATDSGCVGSSDGSDGGTKDIKQGVTKVGGGQRENQGKGISSKLREKDNNEGAVERKENEDGASKEKGRGSGKVKKTAKEEKLGQTDREQPEKKGSTREKETVVSAQEVKKEANDKDMAEPIVSEQAVEDEMGETKDSVSKSSESGGTMSRRKQATPKRRSARLASLNEESPDEQGRGPNEKASGRKKAITEKKKSAAASSKDSSGGRKRQRVLESSSDEESGSIQQQNSSEDEERGYESGTEQQRKEGEEEGKRRKRKRARRRENSHQTDNSHRNEPQSSKRLLAQKRPLVADDTKDRSSSPVLKKIKTKPSGKQLQEERKLSPAKQLQKSPSPVVVTRYFTYSVYMRYHLEINYALLLCRYNRRVKPNRRYTSPTRDSGSDDDTENICAGQK